MLGHYWSARQKIEARRKGGYEENSSDELQFVGEDACQ